MRHSDPNIDHFNSIYKLFWKELYYFAHKRVNDHALAEDLLHDVFLNFLKSNGHQEKDQATIKGYLYTALRNRIVDYHRKNKLQIGLEKNIPSWYSQHENKGLEVTIKREFKEFMDAQIDLMPQQMRRVVLLNNRDGFDSSEIAQKLLISNKTVRNQLSIANQKLRSAFEKFLK